MYTLPNNKGRIKLVSSRADRGYLGQLYGPVGASL